MRSFFVGLPLVVCGVLGMVSTTADAAERVDPVVQRDYERARGFIGKLRMNTADKARLLNIVQVLFKDPKGNFRPADQLPTINFGKAKGWWGGLAMKLGRPGVLEIKPAAQGSIPFADSAQQLVKGDPRLEPAIKAMATVAKQTPGTRMGPIVDAALGQVIQQRPEVFQGGIRGLTAALVTAASVRSTDDRAPLEGRIKIEKGLFRSTSVSSSWWWASTALPRPSILTSDQLAGELAKTSTFSYGSTAKTYSWQAEQAEPVVQKSWGW